VMRACLAGDIDSTRPRLLDQLCAAGGAHIDDVHTAGCCLSESDDSLDRGKLGLCGPRFDKVERSGCFGIGQLRRVLGVNEQNRAELSNSLHALAKRPLVTCRKLSVAARTHEGLESRHAMLDEPG